MAWTKEERRKYAKRRKPTIRIYLQESDRNYLIGLLTWVQ